MLNVVLECIKKFRYDQYYIYIILAFFLYFLIKKQYKSIFYIVSFLSFSHVSRMILKVMLKIPHPNPAFTHTLAFPSSEVFMEIAIICSLFYFTFQNRNVFLTSFILMCVYASWRVIYFGWHDIVDAIGGCLAIVAIFALYFLVLKKKFSLKQLLFFNFYFPFVVGVLLRPRSDVYVTNNTYQHFVPWGIACLVCYIALYVIENWKDIKAKFVKLKNKK